MLLILTSESWHTGCDVPSRGHLLMNQERVKPVGDFHGWGQCFEFPTFSPLTVLVGQQDELPACENLLHVFPEVDCWESGQA